ncbi:hypothetical protein TNCV_535461 [Trichonephila clavipes]|nr:hypothetical protein TNCV_535461 [Trichonephila clavipes]
MERKERWEAPDLPHSFFSLKIGVEPSKIVFSPVWCSRLWLPTGVQICDEFSGPSSVVTEDQEVAPAAFNSLSGTRMFMALETWVRRGGRDFGRGGPMGVQETSPMEVIIDWRMAVSF